MPITATPPLQGPHIAPGMVLAERYHVLRRLGSGGMSHVFAARDLMLARAVAIKVARTDLADSLPPEALLEREARLLARVDHRGVVKVLEVGTCAGRRYLVTELVDGEPLHALLSGLHAFVAPRRNRRPLPRDLERLLGRPLPAGEADLLAVDCWHVAVTAIVIELARALEAVHAAGVVHRDVKSANVMLRGGGHPVLIDLGLGGVLGAADETNAGRLTGTLRNLAPEQVHGHRAGADRRTDLYQLGVVLYEVLTLRHPFPSSDTGRVLDAIKTGTFAPPRAIDSHIPRALEAVCLRALAHDPQARYQTAGALRHDLEAALRRPSPLGAVPIRRLAAWVGLQRA